MEQPHAKRVINLELWSKRTPPLWRSRARACLETKKTGQPLASTSPRASTACSKVSCRHQDEKWNHKGIKIKKEIHNKQPRPKTKTTPPRPKTKIQSSSSVDQQQRPRPSGRSPRLPTAPPPPSLLTIQTNRLAPPPIFK